MAQQLEFPEPEVVRGRISQITDKTMQRCLDATLICCARICEIVGRPKQNEKAYGLRAKDLRVVRYQPKYSAQRYEILVVDVQTAKRGGMLRKVAVPLETTPEAKPLLEYAEQFQPDQFLFDFTRADPLDWISRVEPVFNGLSYPIDTYMVSLEGKLEKIPSHQRNFKLHALRHLRSTELVEAYGFDGFNLAAYGGWKIQTSTAKFGQAIPSVVARYLYLRWQAYIDKLITPSTFSVG